MDHHRRSVDHLTSGEDSSYVSLRAKTLNRRHACYRVGSPRQAGYPAPRRRRASPYAVGTPTAPASRATAPRTPPSQAKATTSLRPRNAVPRASPTARRLGRTPARYPWQRSHGHVPTTLRPTTVDHRTPGLRTHPPTESVLALPFPVARLERLFHFDLLCMARPAWAVPLPVAWDADETAGSSHLPGGAATSYTRRPTARRACRVPPGCAEKEAITASGHPTGTSEGVDGKSCVMEPRPGGPACAPVTFESLSRCIRVSTAANHRLDVPDKPTRTRPARRT